ncbi:MAG: hypothetical protein ACUVWR_13155 [Anaerolineae bacterium]
MGTVLGILAGVLVAGIGGLWLFGERWRPVRASTLKSMREAGFSPKALVNGLHGYVYGRWTNEYLYVLGRYIIPAMGERGRNWLSDRYHGKVLTHDQAKAVITLDRDIEPTDLEQIIPYPMARELVLKGPPDVAVQECGCRHASNNHCEPTQVCMAIGQPGVDFILEHKPNTSRRLTQEEALELLREEH